MSNKMFEGGIIIFIGFLLIAIGFGTLSIGINKSEKHARKERKAREKEEDAKLIAIIEKKPRMTYVVPIPPKEVPVEVDEWEQVPIEIPVNPPEPEPDKPVEPEKPWYVLW